jgi:hypothetical protein
MLGFMGIRLVGSVHQPLNEREFTNLMDNSFSHFLYILYKKFFEKSKKKERGKSPSRFDYPRKYTFVLRSFSL